MKIESMHAYFKQDLHRLKTLLDGFGRFKRTNSVAARACFRQFAEGLRRRVDWEESLLLPVYQRARGADAATRLMRLEHRAIAEQLDSINQRVKSGECETDESEPRLRATLGWHDEEEERVLYPTVDHAATADDREQLRDTVATFERDRNALEYV
jgi:iron-sulfur cluster repair protein YtfE (RIC family)